jgi:hypothetical protein
MPNILDQQNLLKGITDERLSSLLQNPIGVIPPFLVAAEAQRRQAIREQFSGQQPQESVVDTLTRQLAGVPQNIQSSSQAPQAPQGIAAIPQQQEAQPQEAQPEQQTMNSGGYVQRYQDGSLVQTFRGRAGSGGYGAEGPGYSDWFTGLYDYAAPRVESFADRLRRFGVNPDTEQRAQLAAESAAAAEPELKPNIVVTEPRDADQKPRTASPTPPVPPDPNKGKAGTSPRNQTAPAEDEIRKRLEAFYGADDESNWDEAQKWFAMSQQFLKPDTSMLESLVGAGQVYAAGSAEQERERAERQRDAELAMIQYDAEKIKEDRALAALQSEREWELAKEDRDFARRMQEASVLRPSDVIQNITRDIEYNMKRLSDIDEMVIPEEQKQAERAKIISTIENLRNIQSTILGRSGYAPSPTSDQIRSQIPGTV